MAMTVSRLFLCRCGRHFVHHYAGGQKISEPCPSCGGAAKWISWPVQAVPEIAIKVAREPVIKDSPMPRWRRRRQKQGG